MQTLIYSAQHLTHVLLGQQDRFGRDGLDVDHTNADVMSTLSEGLFEPQDAPSRKHRKQLTSTEYALQEIRYAYANCRIVF